MIKSMTGYGRFERSTDDKDILVEIRAVNHRFLECSVRMPKTYSFLEDKIKSYIQGKINRGKVDVFITINSKVGDPSSVAVNHSLAESYVAAINEIADKYGLKGETSASVIARFPDVLTVNKEPADEDKAFDDIFPAIEGAVERFIAMRETEGKRLMDDVLNRCAAIEEMVGFIEKRSPEIVSEYFNRLKSKLQDILDDKNIDEQRIVTEAAVFADKTAVDEETVRLRSHISQIRELLKLSEPIGRKLDFIVQECNREANTIGSKSQNVEITKTVVDIKSEIEKIREQIQNIE